MISRRSRILRDKIVIEREKDIKLVHHGSRESGGPRILSPRKGRGTPRHEIRGILTLTFTLDSVPRGGGEKK